MSSKDANDPAGPPSSVLADEARREALRRIGKFGAYTAPALLAMMVAGQAPAATQL
jgi:hypothetical protein